MWLLETQLSPTQQKGDRSRRAIAFFCLTLEKPLAKLTPKPNFPRSLNPLPHRLYNPAPNPQDLIPNLPVHEASEKAAADPSRLRDRLDWLAAARDR
jgi:hypothetical protein